MSDAETIKATIRKLRERTVARGCSEPEARAALDKAAALMRRHGLDDLDLEMASVPCSRPAKAKPHPRDSLAGAVAWCTSTAALKRHGRGFAEIVYTGPAHRAEIAAYTRDMLEAAVDRAVSGFRRSLDYRRKRSAKARKRAVRAFTEGMVRALSWRLEEAFNGQRDEAIAERSRRWQDRKNPDAADAGRPKPAKDPRAAMLGAAAAADVTLADGVCADRADGSLAGPRRMIGGAR